MLTSVHDAVVENIKGNRLMIASATKLRNLDTYMAKWQHDNKDHVISIAIDTDRTKWFVAENGVSNLLNSSLYLNIQMEGQVIPCLSSGDQ